MNLNRLLRVFAVCGLIALSATAVANTFSFAATLGGASEVPPTASPGTGFALITLDDATNLLTVDLTFSGLTTPATAAHIHCCALPGVNAGVVLPFTAFPATTSGQYVHVFDLTTALTGITETAFLTGLESGLAYTNIHDVNYPGGEIRGQVVPSAVPEPGSLLLLSTGALVMAAVIRRRAHEANLAALPAVEQKK